MITRDLGVLDGPVLLYGGPYSNAAATRAVLDEADHRGIPVKHRICTGDVVAYGGAPRRTVGLVRQRGGTVVAGNVEKQLAAGADGCGCGFAPGTTCDALSGAWYAHADEACGDDIRGWMRGLPDLVTFRHGQSRVAVLHGGVTDIARFLFETSPEDAFREEIAALHRAVGAVDMVVAGHSGLPFLRRIGGITWVNAGAIGLPAHDGRPVTSFAILDDGGAAIHPLAYDIASAIADMHAAGLTQGYDETLRTGWWPSEDVLPPDLRRATRMRA
ncbi:metallophosphoesterase family protein [Pseudaestuariivita atlantica]|uniref:Diadenosine tetraphosphatase n=1 Tax=Pseudaestuariivita atlantica TaxID=1317121 RepID=A0A0L1JMQ2_9RHOB|nr:metallophosphoesterase family protein [Pseudaestuariivita atlantica]KNG93029.1 diadenosine tetraphosphatase [Pseudaestuariivita atlantica]